MRSHSIQCGAAAAALVVAMAASSAAADEPPPRQTPARPTQPPVYEPPSNTVAWVSLVSGGVCLATGIGFGVAAVVEQRRAADIDDRAEEDQTLSSADATSYQDTIDTRDQLRVVSGVAAGTGLGLFLLAGILFARDDAAKGDHARPAAAAAASVHPWIGPGLAGGSATVSF